MSKENLEIRKLGDDLKLFIEELAKIAVLPQGQSTEAMQVCERHFSDLPQRIGDAVVFGHCVFVERKIGDQWQYLLQHGDLMVCDHVPGHMRNSILMPIFRYLTPLGETDEIIWYCMR